MKLTVVFSFCFVFISCQTIYEDDKQRVNKRALQKSHEKPRVEKISNAFLTNDLYENNQTLIQLLNIIATNYLSGCTTLILYDNYTEIESYRFLQHFLKGYPFAFIQGRIQTNQTSLNNWIHRNKDTCFTFILFLKDVMGSRTIINKRSERVVVVAQSSQWRVQEFLASEYSQNIINLLIIVKSDKVSQQKSESPYILYTHRLFMDALGSSQPNVITSWSDGNFSRTVTLFQAKLKSGFSGHRFIISVANQPPFVLKKKRNEHDEIEYDGIEIQLITLLSQMYNFSTDFKEATDIRTLGSAEAVIKSLKSGNVNLAVAGLFLTEDRYNNAGVIHWHSEDCASFISLASTALPRYRAIMGPFRWTVWLSLTLTYLGAVFIFSYSDKMTLNHLIRNPEEIENMFWYVFGTFTNCFTFNGKKSWTKADKNTTKLLVGVYWLFTIIITACYTGSIIAFVTLPVFPSVINTIQQLLGGRFQIGMLDKGGWPYWFINVRDKTSQKLLKKVDYVPDIESGLKNVTKAFFWPYALLASREELSYIVKSNFSLESKKALLHISQQCFVPFKVGVLLPKFSVYSDIIQEGIEKIVQSGLMIKIKNDVEWNMLRSATGKLLAANSKGNGLKLLTYEDRALTLDDTQGMFLLLGAGFLIGASVLISEIFGGCFNICKAKQTQISSASTLLSNRNDMFSLNNSRAASSVLNQYETKDNSSIFESHFGDVIHNYVNESEGWKLKSASQQLINNEMGISHKRSKSNYQMTLY